MKNSKFAKLLPVILAIALLVGILVCLGVSANNDEYDYTIKSINIAHGDRTQVLIALNAPLENAANHKVSYTYNGETYTAKYSHNEEVYGTVYPIYHTVGISAKDMGEQIVATSYKPDNSEAGSKNISVVEYIFIKLYKEGLVRATEGEDLGRKNFLINTLEYGASAQEVLWNYEHPESPRTLVTDLVYIGGNDFLANGKEGGIAEKGIVELTYNGDKQGFAGWKVSSVKDGATVTEFYLGNNINVTSAINVEPYFISGNPTLVDFEGAYTVTDVLTDGVKVFDNINFADRVVTAYDNGATNSYGETKVEVINQSENDKAFHIFAAQRKSGAKDYAPGFKIFTENIDANANATVVELSMTVSNVIPDGSVCTAVVETPFNIFLWGSGYVQYGYQVIKMIDGIIKLNGVEIGKANEEINLKFVYSSSDECMYIYSNDEFKTTLDFNNKAGGSEGFFVNNKTLTSFQIGLMNSGGMSDITIDDVKAYNIALK